MYQSPMIIKELADEITQDFDEKMMKYTMRVVRRYHIDCDEYELRRALMYDRNQYEKGYKEGYREAIEKVRAKLKEVDVEFNYLDSLISEI